MTTRECRVARVMNPACEKEGKNLPNQNETLASINHRNDGG
jgi:hypothetical protein